MQMSTIVIENYYQQCLPKPVQHLLSNHSKIFKQRKKKLFFIIKINSDGMIDCSDSECCSHTVCADHIMCLSSNEPVDVLLRKQPPSVTAPFFQRVKFLIEENSVQSYAHKDEYSER